MVLLAHDFGFLIAVIVLGLQNKGIIWKKLKSILMSFQKADLIRKEDSMPSTTVKTTDYTKEKNRRVHAKRNVWSGFLFGVGLVAFIDETVFHQLLHWHHFYDKSTSDAGLVSDGFFHAFSWFATVASLFLLADLQRRKAWWPKRWLGGMLIGAGAFQLYDGIVHHKFLELHQIRYGVDLLPYDLVWNITAAALLALGLFLLYKTPNTPVKSNGNKE